MGISTAQGNYYFGSGQRESITGPLPGSGVNVGAQKTQGNRQIETISRYQPGTPPQGPNQATVLDYAKYPANPPRGEFHSRTPFWRGNQYVPPEETGRRSGYPDPPSSGPQRPSLHQEYNNWSMWDGSDFTHYADDLTRDYQTVSGNTRMPVIPIGQQDGTYTRIAGGELGFHRVYDRAPDDAGPGNNPVSVEDTTYTTRHGARSIAPGPSYVFNGPPHGLHSQTAPDGLDNLRSRMASPQMRTVRQDRLSNSHYSGQSYSAATQHQGGGGGKQSKSRTGVTWK